jgi:hypothetical protein
MGSRCSQLCQPLVIHLNSSIMKQILKYRLFLIIGSIIFCSCELTKEIDYSTTGKSDWIVINGFISKEYGVNVVVKKTVPPNQLQANDIIENANVWLYINNKAFARLIKIDEYHYSLPPDSIDFTPDARYSIHVDAIGMESASSGVQQLLVSKLEIDTVYIVRDTIKWDTRLFIEFDDDPANKNYYAIAIDYFKDGQNSDHQSEEIVSKRTFSDEGYGLRIKTSYQHRYEVFDSIQVRLFSVSSEYHRFISSYWDYEISYGDYNYETQYVVDTQIENGFGFFASYEVSKFIYK